VPGIVRATDYMWSGLAAQNLNSWFGVGLPYLQLQVGVGRELPTCVCSHQPVASGGGGWVGGWMSGGCCSMCLACAVLVACESPLPAVPVCCLVAPWHAICTGYCALPVHCCTTLPNEAPDVAQSVSWGP